MLTKRIAPILLIVAAGCTPQTVDGRKEFVENCAACHGRTGVGDGPMAANLIREPSNLTTLAERNNGVFPRDYVMSTIDGLNRDPHFSGAMPEFGEGDMGAQVMVGRTPVPAKLLALTNYLESIQN